MAKFASVLAFFALAWLGSTSAQYTCTGATDYLYPVREDCASYYVCTEGSSIAGKENCLIYFLKLFNPQTRRCDWPWLVDCSAQPSIPKPTPPPPANATTVTEGPTTTVSTVAPTTAPTTVATPPTPAPTAAPTPAPAK